MKAKGRIVQASRETGATVQSRFCLWEGGGIFAQVDGMLFSSIAADRPKRIRTGELVLRAVCLYVAATPTSYVDAAIVVRAGILGSLLVTLWRIYDKIWLPIMTFEGKLMRYEGGQILPRYSLTRLLGRIFIFEDNRDRFKPPTRPPDRHPHSDALSSSDPAELSDEERDKWMKRIAQGINELAEGPLPILRTLADDVDDAGSSNFWQTWADEPEPPSPYTGRNAKITNLTTAGLLDDEEDLEQLSDGEIEDMRRDALAENHFADAERLQAELDRRRDIWPDELA